MSEETSHMEFASVSPAELSAQDVTFAVNRLTHQQYLDALDNTVIDKAQNTIVSAVNPSFMSLRPNQFYMTVDEDIKGDFQLSSYVSLVDFYQQTSSMLNFRGVTHDSEWAGQFVTALTASDSPGDVYAGASPSHGDVVFYSENGQEFMYTKSEPPGYWSQIGNDWMLSVIKVTTQAAFSNVSGYIEYLSNYASAYLSGEISGLSDQLDATSSYISGQVHGHITNAGNPHQVTAGQVKAYLCSETSSAAELQTEFNSKLGVSLSVNAIGDDLGKIPDVGAVKNYTSSATELNAKFQNYYLTSNTSSAGELYAAFGNKLDTSLCVNTISDDTPDSAIADVGALRGYFLPLTAFTQGPSIDEIIASLPEGATQADIDQAVADAEAQQKSEMSKLKMTMNTHDMFINVHSDSTVDEKSPYVLSVYTSSAGYKTVRVCDAEGRQTAVKSLNAAVKIANTVKFLENAYCRIHVLDDQELSVKSDGSIDKVVLWHPDLVQDRFFYVYGIKLRQDYPWNDIPAAAATEFCYRRIFAKFENCTVRYSGLVAAKCNVSLGYLEFDTGYDKSDFTYSGPGTKTFSGMNPRGNAAFQTSELVSNVGNGSPRMAISNCTFTGGFRALCGSNIKTSGILKFRFCVYPFVIAPGEYSSVGSAVDVARCLYFLTYVMGGQIYHTALYSGCRLQTTCKPVRVADGGTYRMSAGADLPENVFMRVISSGAVLTADETLLSCAYGELGDGDTVSSGTELTSDISVRYRAWPFGTYASLSDFAAYGAAKLRPALGHFNVDYQPDGISSGVRTSIADEQASPYLFQSNTTAGANSDYEYTYYFKVSADMAAKHLIGGAARGIGYTDFGYCNINGVGNIYDRELWSGYNDGFDTMIKFENDPDPKYYSWTPTIESVDLYKDGLIDVDGNWLSAPEQVFVGKSAAHKIDGAFKDCPTLKYVRIEPGMMREITNGAFSGCTALEGASVPSNVSVSEDAFEGYEGGFDSLPPPEPDPEPEIAPGQEQVEELEPEPEPEISPGQEPVEELEQTQEP